MHWLELPLAEWMERNFAISSFFSATQVSLMGVALGLLCGGLVASSSSKNRLLGVLAYKARDLADSLDGVVARGAGSRVVRVSLFDQHGLYQQTQSI